ncbi:MAG: hypothetical protein AB1599_01335 [Planctomycetota bacterium]
MTEAPTTMQIFEVWLAVGFTLMIYSFLYKDNPLFKLGEYMYVGLSAGYALCGDWFQIVWPDLVKPLYSSIKYTLGGEVAPEFQVYKNLWLFVPLILGIFMLTRFSHKLNWLSRYTFAFIMGTTSGMAIPYVVSADLFKQIEPVLKPFIGSEIAITQAINAILIIIGVITVLVYFFFSMEHKGPVKTVARVGIFYMMIAFGAAFGYTVMARESLAIGRLTKLVNWSKTPDYYYAPIILFFVVAGIIVLWELLRKKTPPGTENQSP